MVFTPHSNDPGQTHLARRIEHELALEAATEFRIMTMCAEELKSRTTLAEAFASIIADSEKKITERIGGLEREASEVKAKILELQAELQAEASEVKANILELQAENSESKATSALLNAKILELQAQSSERKAANTSLQESLKEFRQESRNKIREIKERMGRESTARAAETLALQDKIKRLGEEGKKHAKLLEDNVKRVEYLERSLLAGSALVTHPFG